MNSSETDDIDVYKCFKKYGLHFVHINVHSLLPNPDELYIIANKSKAAVIGMTKTWLDDSVGDFEIELLGYVVQRKKQTSFWWSGGGTCIYIRSDIAFNPRSDLCGAETEAAWVELPSTESSSHPDRGRSMLQAS